MARMYKRYTGSVTFVGRPGKTQVKAVHYRAEKYDNKRFRGLYQEALILDFIIGQELSVVSKVSVRSLKKGMYGKLVRLLDHAQTYVFSV